MKLFVPISLNAASREEILLVPGVGPRMAQEFEEYRPYRLDDRELSRLESYVTLE